MCQNKKNLIFILILLILLICFIKTSFASTNLNELIVNVCGFNSDTEGDCTIITYKDVQILVDSAQSNDTFEEIKIKMNNIQEIKLIKNNICNIFSFKIDDSNSSTFLGCSGDVKNLKFEIETDASFDKLISFNMSYSQELTETYFILNPYYGSANITIPEI